MSVMAPVGQTLIHWPQPLHAVVPNTGFPRKSGGASEKSSFWVTTPVFQILEKIWNIEIPPFNDHSMNSIIQSFY